MSRPNRNKHGNKHEVQADDSSGLTAGSRQHLSENVNLNDAERHFSMIGGSALVLCGLLRGSLSGLAMAALGGALIYRGHTGHCHMYETLEYSSVGDTPRQESYGPEERSDAGSEALKIQPQI